MEAISGEGVTRKINLNVNISIVPGLYQLVGLLMINISLKNMSCSICVGFFMDMNTRM